MNAFNLTRGNIGGITVLTLSGSLDMYAFPRFETALNSCFDTQDFRIILRCEGVEYFGSAGMGALVGMDRFCQEHGGRLQVVGLSERLRKMVELLGFDSYLILREDVESALQAFGVPPIIKE